MRQRSRKTKLQALNIRSLGHLGKQLGSTPEELERLCQVVGRASSRYYAKREIVTRGKRRTTMEPLGRLREVLNKLQALLQRAELPKYFHGCIAGHDNITNASRHVNQNLVITLDLRDFFPSVRHTRVYAVFTERLGCSPDVAHILTRLTTLEGALPQGSPTSPILSVLVLESFGRRVQRLCRMHGAEYTQYVDDITVSGSGKVGELVATIERIAEQQGFDLNVGKTKLRYSLEEQVVTGVRVNKGVDVPSDKLAEVRRLLVELEQVDSGEYRALESKIRTARGKIGYLSRLNRGVGRHYHRRLRRIERCLAAPARIP